MGRRGQVEAIVVCLEGKVEHQPLDLDYANQDIKKHCRPPYVYSLRQLREYPRQEHLERVCKRDHCNDHGVPQLTNALIYLFV